VAIGIEHACALVGGNLCLLKTPNASKSLEF